jgi:hypothetical protein
MLLLDLLSLRAIVVVVIDLAILRTVLPGICVIRRIRHFDASFSLGFSASTMK